MKRAKIFFTDLDGTLLNSRKQVSPEDKAAVLEALEQGCRIAVNTGRPLPAVLPLLERTGLNRQGCFAVTYNGGLIYDCGSGENPIQKTPAPDVCPPYFSGSGKSRISMCRPTTSKA